MIFPEFLKEGSTVGITAPSFGLDEKHCVMLERAEERFRARGWKYRETPNVRLPACPSSSAEQRGRELNGLVSDGETDYILCASGGDFLVEMLSYLDFEAFQKHPKFVQGYSDPTGLLFPLTTRLDIATVYGPNASGLGNGGDHPAIQNALDIMGGRIPVQQSFALHETFTDCFHLHSDGSYELCRPVSWRTPNGDVEAEGRLIGGCLDVLDILRGTPYEDAAGFAKRYAGEGLIWYFDIFALQAEQVFYALWGMKQAGWFEGAQAFLFGRVAFPGSQGLLKDYESAVCRALGDVRFVLEADVGHVSPAFTLINGAKAKLSVKAGKGILKMEIR